MKDCQELREVPVAPNYGCTPDGRIFSHYKARFMKPSRKKNGYLQIPLRVDGKYKTFLIHRLVAITYLGECTLEVNHKDGDKVNNHVTNLEWVTRHQNLAHALRKGLLKTTPLQVAKGVIGHWFPSGVACMEATGLTQQDVSRLSTGSSKTAKGWRAV